MTDAGERPMYEEIKRDLADAIAQIRARCPDAADYLSAHIEYDDDAMTIRYTGDVRIQIREITG